MSAQRLRPELSVVITNHNYGRYLDAAVGSALCQGGRTEVIVVDDGSDDDSREVAAGLHDSVRVILQDNRGQASAFNAGFAVSSGDVIVFLDADDMLEPDVASTLTTAFKSGAVHAHWQLLLTDAQGRPSGGLRPPPARGGPTRARGRSARRWSR